MKDRLCNRRRLWMRIHWKYLLLCLACALCAGNAFGQKKAISAARDLLKSGKNLDAAQQSMEKLLDDSANRQNEKIWTTLYDVLHKQYEQGNEQLYLKQQYDTTALFMKTRRLFQVAVSLDSLEASSHKGKREKVKFKFRDVHAQFLNMIRPNLYNGGLYFIHKQNYKDGYDFLTSYISCARESLFRKYKYADTDHQLPVAAYWAVYCGYKMRDPKATLHHAYLALKDTAHYVYMLQYLADTYRLEGDTARYVSSLREGFSKYPSFPFFFPRLVDYDVKQGNYKAAIETTDRALKERPKSLIYRFTKSTLLLNTQQYPACIDLCDSILADTKNFSKDSLKAHPAIAGAYLNAGLAYFNQAVELDKSMSTSRKERNRMLEYYRKALPYLVHYRELEPEDKSKWALPLYTIYLNLNMGKEFDEIDKLLENK
ncbi:MAG: hypothetical protein LKG50_00335 [Prevotella sp.]|nr:MULTISPECIES: hypothetical protein [unclassified Prevotella]MCI1290807.1 hypothetical protein [Prevotella sp.]